MENPDDFVINCLAEEQDLQIWQTLFLSLIKKRVIL